MQSFSQHLTSVGPLRRWDETMNIKKKDRYPWFNISLAWQFLIKQSILVLPCVSSFSKPGVDDSGGGTLEQGIISLEGEKGEACVRFPAEHYPSHPSQCQHPRQH